jgi:hypothetical protein
MAKFVDSVLLLLLLVMLLLLLLWYLLIGIVASDMDCVD